MGELLIEKEFLYYVITTRIIEDWIFKPFGNIFGYSWSLIVRFNENS